MHNWRRKYLPVLGQNLRFEETDTWPEHKHDPDPHLSICDSQPHFWAWLINHATKSPPSSPERSMPMVLEPWKQQQQPRQQKDFQMRKQRFLKGLRGWMRTRTVTHRAIIFSPFPSVRLLHHEINDLPFEWSEDVLLRGAYLSRGRLCRCSFAYVFACLHVYLFGFNESLRSECCGGLRILGWSSFCPHWHEAFCNKLLTLPTCLLGLSLTKLPQHVNTLKGSSAFHGGHEEKEAPANWSLLSC